MIVTITMNPAIDKLMVVPDFSSQAINRAVSSSETIGGKGINVSKTLKSLGKESIAMGFMGGENGRYIKNRLTALGIRHDFVEVQGKIRENIKILMGSGNQISVNDTGFTVTHEDFERLKDRVMPYASNENVVVIGGSLPVNASHEDFRMFCEEISKKGTKLIVDTDSEHFDDAIYAKPCIMACTASEMGAYGGFEGYSEDKIIQVAKDIISRGVKSVFCMDGNRGAVFCSENFVYRVELPQVQAICSVGAVAASIAAMAVGLANGMDEKELAKYATATGAASMLSTNTNMVMPSEVFRIFEQTDIFTLSGKFKPNNLVNPQYNIPTQNSAQYIN